MNEQLKQMWLVLAIVAPTLLGCGDNNGMAPVEGVVTLDGKPVANAAVCFIPSGEGRPATGRTDSNGVFELKTFEPGDGAKVGKHRVTVIAVEQSGATPSAATDDGFGSLQGFGPRQRPPKKRWIVPQAYSKPRTSGLEVEVVAGNNTPKLELSSKL